MVCGNSLADPLASTLNVFVPLGLVVHVGAIVLSSLKMRGNLFFSILQLFLFVSVSILTVLIGECVFILWLEGFTLNERVWWLF